MNNTNIIFNDLNKIKDKVKLLLVEHPSTKDNDNELVCWFWYYESKNENKDFSFRDFLTEYKNNNYTNSDNITRVRRKLQEKEINLRGKTYNKRQNICSDLKNKIHKL